MRASLKSIRRAREYRVACGDWLYAFYSPSADRNFGYAIYKSPSGAEVRLTEVRNKRNPFSRHCDIRPVGFVVHYMRGGFVTTAKKIPLLYIY